MRIGVGVTVAGLLATVIAMLPLIFPDITLPGVWWFLAMITGVGLALVIFGLVLAARERRHPRS
jgi:VIT1/CCC1 family predicted Fe2+/Mn2+ transporter